MKELIAQNIPALQRAQRIQKLPCKQHGHPGWIPSRLMAWINFYKVILPYNPSQTALDHSLVSKICDEYHLNFVDAFEMLTIIHELVREKQDGSDKGLQKSGKQYEETSPEFPRANGDTLS